LQDECTRLRQQVNTEIEANTSLQDQVNGLKNKLHQCETEWSFHKTHHDQYHIDVKKIAEDLGALEQVGRLHVVQWLPILSDIMRSKFYAMKQEKHDKEKELGNIQFAHSQLQRELATVRNDLAKSQEADKQCGDPCPHLNMLRTVTRERENLKKEKGKWEETVRRIKREADESSADLRGSRENNAFWVKRNGELAEEGNDLRNQVEELGKMCTRLQGVEQNFQTEKSRREELEKVRTELEQAKKRSEDQVSRLIRKEVASKPEMGPGQGPIKRRDRGGESGDDETEKEGEPTKKGKTGQWE
ncbi:MAG: hypothetical protein Q9174_006523, partial [Haloplaca sp. 1 TL-2023]